MISLHRPLAATLVLWLLALFVTPGARSEEPRSSGEARLTLEGALFRTDSGGERVPADLHLDLVLEDGEFEDEVWGYATSYDDWGLRHRSFNATDHRGRLESVTRVDVRTTRLEVTLEVYGNLWNYSGTEVVAEARYRIRLEREGDRCAGSFEGTFGSDRVAGRVRGRVEAPVVRYIEGHRPVEPGEHPRLIFRASDVPGLRRRAQETPEGRRMVARLEERLAADLPWTSRPPGHWAAGHGLLWVLRGDREHAKKARTIIEQMMRGRGFRRRVLNQTPRTMAAALAWDLCYDAWDEPFRRKVAAWLEEQMLELWAGSRQGLNQHPHSNWMGIFHGSQGVTAMALLGEPGEYPKPPRTPLETDVAPDTDWKPAPGVPVVRLEDGRMARRWIMIGPFPTGEGGDFLAPIGGRRNARPAPGTEVEHKGRTLSFRATGEESIWVHEHFTFGAPALDLLVPIDRAFFTTSYWYTVLENEAAGWYRYESDTRAGGKDARAWLAGTALGHGDLVRLEKGLYPLMLEVSLGSTTPWGRILAQPRFTRIDTESERAEREARMKVHASRRARWERGHAQWIASGKTVPSAAWSLRRAERGVRRFLERGVGDHGFHVEGEGYLRFTMTAGLLQFLHAWRTAQGKEFAGATGVDWLLLLPTLTGIGPEGKRPALGPAGWSNTRQQEERSGAFVTGFSTVPPEKRPAVKWWFDRTFGFEGDRTFNVFLPSQAAYALVNYPFGAKAVNPGELLPRAVRDSLHDYVACRKGWRDADDLLTVILFKASVRNYVHQAKPVATLRIVGFDRLRADVEKVGEPGATTWLSGLGGDITHWDPRPDGSAVFTADLSEAYRGDPPAKGEPPADRGIEARRAIAVDYSERAGVPGLWAVVDSIEGGGEKTWRMACEGNLAVDGRRFTVRARDNVVLSGVFAAPKSVQLRAGKNALEAKGGDNWFVVLTLGKDESPEFAIEGEGLDATVRVKGRAVRFDGGQLVLEDR